MSLELDLSRFPLSLLDLLFFTLVLRRELDAVDEGEASTGASGMVATTGARNSTCRGADSGLSSTSLGTLDTSITDEEEKSASVNTPLAPTFAARVGNMLDFAGACSTLGFG